MQEIVYLFYTHLQIFLQPFHVKAWKLGRITAFYLLALLLTFARHMRKMFAFLLLMCLAAVAQGQKEWSYEECIRYALDNNLELANARYDIETIRLNYKAALYSFLPSVGATSGYDINIGKTVDPNTNDMVDREFFSNSYGISASLVLFNGFRKINEAAFGKYNTMAGNSAFEAARNELAFLVLNACAAHLIQQGLWKIQSEQQTLSEREVLRIKKYIELGLASGSDLYDAEARLARDEFLLVQLDNMAKKSLFQLQKLMNMPFDSTLAISVITIAIPETNNPSSDSLFRSAKEKMPQIKMLERRLDAAKKQVRIAQSSLTPTLSAYGGISAGYYETSTDEYGAVIPYTEQLKNNRRMAYGLSLQIPLLNGFSRRIYIRQAAVAREQTSNALQIGLQELENDIQEALLEQRGAEAEYYSALKREAGMRQAFRIAERKREKGLISMMEYDEAKNNLGNAAAESLRAGLQRFLAEITIRFYMTGEIISPNE